MMFAQSGAFWTGVGLVAAQWLIPIVFGLLSMVVFAFLARQSKEKIYYAKQSLSLVKAFLGRRLGDKTGAVVDAWLKGIKSIEDGEFCRADGIDQFVEFVVIAAKNNGVDLSEDEIAAIREAITNTLELLDVKAKPTQQAVTIMMVESKLSRSSKPSQ
jgi:hypothetical protein